MGDLAEGAPVQRLLLETAAGPRAVFGTDRGSIAIFAAPQALHRIY